MQTRRENRQSRLVLLEPLEERIRPGHLLRRIQRVLDLSFVHEVVRDRYSQDNGRPSVDPEVIIRLFLLQAIYGIRSVRELMEEVDLHLGYRWFIGYELDEELPDHSTLSKALDRFGDEIFNELFERSIAQCREKGLISGKMFHVDATTIRADLDKTKVRKGGNADIGEVSRTDADARFGRFGDGSQQPGYKQQTVADDNAGVVVGVSVTAANGSDDRALIPLVDEASERLGVVPEVVCADGGYGSGGNAASCEERGIRFVSPPQPVPKNRAGHYTIDRFVYDEAGDEFSCPAGERLVYAGRTGKKGQRKYRCRQKVCKRCELKGFCTKAEVRCLTVSPNHGALVRLRADSQTESFRKLYRRRAPVIEGVFAVAKQRHGLRRAWRRGLAKMRIQCLLVASVINFKKLVTLFLTFLTLPTRSRVFLCAVRRFKDLFAPIAPEIRFRKECLVCQRQYA